MENLEGLETTNLESDVVKDTKEALDPLKQDIEYRGLESMVNQIYNFAKQLDAQYRALLWTNPRLVQPQPTNVFAEWSVFLVYDAEYNSSYALQLYWSYDVSENKLRDPWRLPELILFDKEGARTTHKLDPAQYKEVCYKIVDILNREAEQISKLTR